MMRTLSKKLSKTLSLTLLALLLSTLNTACTSLLVKVPGPLVESPELPGTQGKIEFGGGIDDAMTHKFVEDASRRPPTLNEPQLTRRDVYAYGRGGYSATDWLELGARYIPGGGSWGLGVLGGLAGTVRAQLIGVGERTPGWKMAVYGGFFFTHTAISGDQDGNFGNGGYNWTAQASVGTSTAGTSLGYRFPDQNLLVFLALSYANQRTSGKIEHKQSDNGTSPAATYDLPELSGNARTLGLGLRFGETFIFGLDARLLDRSWPNLATPDTRGGGTGREAMVLASFAFTR